MYPLSEFQFSNPILLKLDYKMNSSFKSEETGVDFSFPVMLNIARSNQEAHRSDVMLELILGKDGDSSPFHLTIAMQATFQWGEKLSDDVVEQLLTQNAPSLLLSYIRPHVVQITSASPFPVVHIPFADFSKSENGVKGEETTPKAT